MLKNELVIKASQENKGMIVINTVVTLLNEKEVVAGQRQMQSF